jgi:hypothetical protein
MKIICVILIVLGFCFINIDGNATEWIWHGGNNLGISIYYDKETVVFDGNRVKVWEKRVYTSTEARANFVSQLAKAGLPTEGFENLSYTVSLMEFDCVKRKVASPSGTHYDDKGRILVSYRTNKESDKLWDDIAPDSVGETLYKIVCTMKKNKAPANKAPKGVK